MTPDRAATQGQPVSLVPLGRRGWDSPVPTPLTRLIGRQQERQTASDLLRGGTRLVTLTGPGGIGKTRLALQIGSDLETEFDGVIWIPLTQVRDPDAVLAVVASSVGLVGGASLERLIRAIRGDRLLLVIDNFEQVIDAAPRIADLLAACPKLHALVTSRSLLRIRGEYTLSLPPLSTSAATQGPRGNERLPAHDSPDTTHLPDAVALFVERAAPLAPDGSLSDANTATIEAICARLDGLPLAIELAAARMSHLPLPSLLDHLDRRLPLLIEGARDLPERQRTMRDAIAWSFELLLPAEQRLFRRLAVFEGGFTLAAAEAVDTGDPDPGDPRPVGPGTLDLLRSLVEKSLVRQELSDSGEPRYTMFETIREFASEHLAESGATTAARQNHAAFFQAQAERDGMADLQPDGDRRLDGLEAERANMRAALTWLEDSGQPERCLEMATMLGGFWFARSHLREGQEWLERSLAKYGGAPSLLRARALVWLGSILILRGETDEAERVLTEGLVLSRTHGDAFFEAQALLGLGFRALYFGDPVRGAVHLTEGMAAAETVPDPRLASLMIGRVKANLGIAARERGQLTEAKGFLEEALRQYQAIAYRAGERRSEADLAYLAVVRGEYAEAMNGYQVFLARARGERASRDTQVVIVGVAIAAAGLGWHELSTRWLGAAETLGERLGLGPLVDTYAWPVWNRALESARGALGEAAFAASWAAGRALRTEQVFAEILDSPAVQRSAKVRTSAAVTHSIDGQEALSAREMDVLRLLVAGQSDRAIGAALFISHRTVEFHVSRILAKLGVASRSAAVAAAFSAGLVDPSAPSSAPE